MKKHLLTILSLSIYLTVSAQTKKDSTYIKTVTLNLDDYQKLTGLANAYQANVIWNPYIKDATAEQRNVTGWLVGLDGRLKLDSVRVKKPLNK